MVAPLHRWPAVGACALAPVTTLALRRPALRPLAALLWHQTEEWVWPGGFRTWLNREILGSDADDFPLDERDGFVVNVVFGWGLSLATADGPRAAVPAAALYVSHLGNAGLHLGWAVRNRRYDPGAVTALGTLTPVAVRGLRRLYADPRVSRRTLAAGAAVGVASSLALPVLLRRRMDTQRRARL